MNETLPEGLVVGEVLSDQVFSRIHTAVDTYKRDVYLEGEFVVDATSKQLHPSYGAQAPDMYLSVQDDIEPLLDFTLTHAPKPPELLFVTLDASPVASHSRQRSDGTWHGFEVGTSVSDNPILMTEGLIDLRNDEDTPRCVTEIDLNDYLPNMTIERKVEAGLASGDFGIFTFPCRQLVFSNGMAHRSVLNSSGQKQERLFVRVNAS